MTTTITGAFHVAVLDPMTGYGLFVLPCPEEDAADPFGGRSVHSLDGIAILAELDRLGWEPVEDDEIAGCWDHVEYLPDGREVVALYGREPIVSVPCQRQGADALAELRRMVLQHC